MWGSSVVDLCTFAWPASSLAEAIATIARREKLASQSALEFPPTPQHLSEADEETIEHWLAVLASPWGLEVEPVQLPYAEAVQAVQHVAPALLRLPEGMCEGERRFLVLLRGRRWWLSFIGPDLRLYRVHPEIVRVALCHHIEAPHLASIDQFLADVQLPPHRYTRVRQAILREQLGGESIRGCWLLRLSPGAGLWQQARVAHLPRALLLFLGGHLVQLHLTIIAWWIVGYSALTGHLDWGWLSGWVLVLLTVVACQALALVARSQLARGVGGIFRLRLLHGTLQLDPEEIRHQGAGQFFGRVMESEAVELLAINGGLAVVLAVMQLGMALVLLPLGAGGWAHALLLALWVVVVLVSAWRHWRRGQTWSDAYREMTNDLIERMVGHRTRLAQEDPAHWHDEEDQLLDHYGQCSEQLDRTGSLLQALVPRGWAVLGLAAIAYAMLLGQQSPALLAIGLGGMLLALQGLTRLASGIQGLTGAAIAWRQIGPLLQTLPVQSTLPRQPMAFVGPDHTRQTGAALVTARDLGFRYRGRGSQALQACSVQIQYGDRLLLEGPSGGGKSTFAALLAGLRDPESGLLLLWGYDRHTIGRRAWRQRVVVAPQFHENHVITETLAFNLLMGRRWLPLPADLTEAETVCRELGLGDLLDRMPAGLQQMVGESGWQLSHGERSRLYIARALLQQADLLILDESFGALDPGNLQRALRCVLQRAPTLLVIAHP